MERVMKHLDHSMIFVLIAGSYTPITLLALPPAWASRSSRSRGSAHPLESWSPSWRSTARGGWASSCTSRARLARSGRDSQVVRSLSRVELALLLTGGLLYTVARGAGLQASRPPPFGVRYHEVWHTFVVAAGVCHFVLVLLLVGA